MLLNNIAQQQPHTHRKASSYSIHTVDYHHLDLPFGHGVRDC